MISLKKRQSERLLNLALCGIFFAFLFIITEQSKPLKKGSSYTNNTKML